MVGATKALRYTKNLPRFPSDFIVPQDHILDIFDFLHYAFGFQVNHKVASFCGSLDMNVAHVNLLIAKPRLNE